MNLSPTAPKPAVPLVDVLLRIRQDMRERKTGPYQYIGMPYVHWMRCFVDGYGECLRLLGVEEGADLLFGEWLRDVKKAWPGQGWDHAYLEEFEGDHSRALLKYLDFVAEFRELPPEALAAIVCFHKGEHPAARRPSLVPTQPPTPTLDYLLEIRREVGDVEGRLGLFIGYIEVERMAGFIDGYRLCLALAGARDEEYARFERWLHEARGLPAGQTWPAVYLAACQGNAEQAIRRLLEDVALFRGV